MKLKEINIRKSADSLKSVNQNFLHYASFRGYESDFIKPQAFENADSLVIVTDCGDVKVIGERAFASCSKLERFDGVPYSVGDEAFKFCSSLKDFNFNSVKQLSNAAFEFSGLLKANFSDSIQFIPYRCFANCLHLTSINLNKIESIEEAAFSMTGLKMIELPYYLQEIGPSAFESSFRLTDIVCSSPVPPKLGNKAFANTSIQNIWFLSEDIRQTYLKNRQWSKWSDKMKLISAKGLIERSKEVEIEDKKSFFLS